MFLLLKKTPLYNLSENVRDTSDSVKGFLLKTKIERYSAAHRQFK